ncbi:MAG: hypothetical protein NTW21_22895 [Verrucomicrobia bacterium]|nr:hypothetical protein [Verrucomicrobiota bacterium]
MNYQPKLLLSVILSLAVAGLSAQAETGKAPAKKSKNPSDAIAEENHEKAVARFADILAKYDTNKNGKIDDSEKAAMPEKTRQNFELTMSLHDKNKDGIIDKKDLAATLAEQHKAERNYERLKRTRRPNEN